MEGGGQAVQEGAVGAARGEAVGGGCQQGEVGEEGGSGEETTE